MLENLNELRAFVVVAQTGSFTKAGERLGVSTSALSHSIRKLEEQLKVKLFHRTTRSISTTEAGEQLFRQLQPLFERIEDNVNALNSFRDTLSGKLRINGSDHAFTFALWEKFADFLRRYPEVELELTSDAKFVDIVAGRFDAGIRLGEALEQDMIAARVSNDMQMAVVATPQYLAEQGIPKTVEALKQHQCINIKMPSGEGIIQWEFRQPNSQEIVKFNPKGRLILNNNFLAAKACLSHLGLAWMPKDRVQVELDSGELVEVLSDYTMNYGGYYLYYPNRHQNSPLFKALVAALRG